MEPDARRQRRGVTHPLLFAALFLAASPGAAVVAAQILAGTFDYRPDK